MPGTWREAEAGKTERLRREHELLPVHYAPSRPDLADVLSPVLCAGGCGLRLPRALTDQGWRDHPTCGPEMKALARRTPLTQPATGANT